MTEETKLGELDRLISRGKQKGFLTYDEVNDALPADMVSFDQLDDIMMMFGSMDIEVVDSAKAGPKPWTRVFASGAALALLAGAFLALRHFGSGAVQRALIA